MNSTDVNSIYKLLEENNIVAWLDGGWGVDALLGKQTRMHADIDIVIQQKDVLKLRELLSSIGYKDAPRDDTTSWNFVLGDSKGHLIDIHAIVFDERGNGIYGPAEKGVMYPASSLQGSGMISGKEVRCLAPEYQIKSHVGYELDDNDINDVLALCKQFKIKLPKEMIDIQRAA